MLNYHFDKKLITTQRLLSELSIKISELDAWKFKWRKLHYDKSKSELPYEDWKKENDSREKDFESQQQSLKKNGVQNVRQQW